MRRKLRYTQNMKLNEIKGDENEMKKNLPNVRFTVEDCIDDASQDH
jgi:hypothetical protein